MDTKQLRAFVETVDCGSLSRASQRLHLSQPALSRQIRLLEESVGQPLFLRTGRGLEPTESGRWLRERAVQLLAELEGLKEQVTARRGQLSGRVRLGCLPSVVDLLVDRVLPDFRQAHAGVSLDVQVLSSSSEICDALLDRRLDLGTLYDVALDPRLAVKEIDAGALMLVAPARSRFAAGAPVPFRELRALSLILPRRGQGLRRLIERQTVHTGVELEPWMEANAPQLMLALVRRGLAHTILPWPAIARAVAHGEVAAAPISEPGLSYRFVAARLSARPLSPAGAALLAGMGAPGHR